MKSIHVRLMTPEGDELDSISVDEFVIAEAWDESPAVESEEDIIQRVDNLYHTLLQLLRERQAAPSHGRMQLKLTLGEALLTADAIPGAVMIDVTVRPLEEEEDDECDELE